jgi:UDP-N-acetylglucosamine 3-dehydrogenase
MPDIRVGLIGLGSMGSHHARIIRETPGMDLVAVADPRGDRFGVVRSLDVLRGVEDLVRGGVDAAVVAAPTIYHEEAALALAAAGIPTLVEKPIAHSADAARRVANAFASAGVFGAVGHVERCNPALVEMRKQIAEGALGEVFQIVTSRQSTFPVRVSDVGVVKDLAAHDIDLTPWLVQSTYATVFAQVSYRSGRSYEDLVAVTGRLVNGIIVSHLVNWLSPRKVRQTLVIGEGGALVADTAAGDLTFYANGTAHNHWDSIASFTGGSQREVLRYALTEHQPLRIEHENFRDALIGRPNSCVTMEEGVNTLVVLEAILESAERDQVIHL